MSSERFDHLARALAQGATRRQVLKGFAAGLGASVLATLGHGVPAGAQAAPFAQSSPSKGFLPLIRRDGISGIDMCPVASTCENKFACNDGGPECRCLQSAEGVIHCGTVPSCGSQTCTTSADCANLGPGYFCDSPDSGCCNEGVQLCIAPCSTPMTECPPERLCGNVCCPQGYTCENGKCVNPLDGATMTGTWTGTLAYGEQTINIRLVLTEEKTEFETLVQGRILFQDPVTLAWLETGAVNGDRTNLFTYLVTEAESVIGGDLDKDSFVGNYKFQDTNGESELWAELAMTRS